MSDLISLTVFLLAGDTKYIYILQTKARVQGVPEVTST